MAVPMFPWPFMALSWVLVAMRWLRHVTTSQIMGFHEVSQAFVALPRIFTAVLTVMQHYENNAMRAFMALP